MNVSMETLFVCLTPCEIVLPENRMSEFTEIIVSRYVNNSKETVRLERLDSTAQILASVNELKTIFEGFSIECLTQCLSLAEQYLRQFKLNIILQSPLNFRKFSLPQQWMTLDGITLRNLEIFQNSTDGGVRGSLFSILDHTCTPFGRRLLRKWITHPLIHEHQINDRLDAVTEILQNWESDSIKSLRRGLAGCSDLENGLTMILLRKATPAKFVKFVDELEKLRVLFLKHSQADIRIFSTSSLVSGILTNVPSVLGSRLSDLLLQFNRPQAEKNDKNNLFNATDEFYPEVFLARNQISLIEQKLENYRKTCLPKLLNKLRVEFKCVSGLEYLVEIKNSELKSIPSDWFKIGATKQVTRFRPPFVDEWFKELCRTREQLTIASNNAWSHFLSTFSYHYDVCKEVIEKIGSFDCLMSLAVIAKQPGYCRPLFEGDGINIQDGRHPVLESLLSSDNQYVSNDTNMINVKKV